ncbi:YheC/YheD family endospore coat-associated protein [Candidatus Contubernalis alkaliaceticus]|uniref:YheC/YheD family endospore coat-associated protein n=1 Tax=Candidatus Contubernalis alkaliaceticus TaxID=338645 RepID=UPI001F4BE6FA|nr:YheC/YheD family protein [Candidatus Contubernalis alkalaceticus]UNC92231.1 YheC/YheD family protein [Candidatus Contubernalis alkalaceticus]
MNYLWFKSLKSTEAAVNLNLYNRLQCSNLIIINVGTLKKHLKVIINNDLLDNTIGLPISLSNKYTIPTEIPYEIYHKDREIHLGPVIAYIVMGSFYNLNKKKLTTHLPRFSDYMSIKGLIYICTKDSIDLARNRIKGYYYDPKGVISGRAWWYGEFPLPDAIFNRSFLSQNKVRALQKKIGNNIFNSYFRNLNKWNIYRKLSKDKKLIKHLPYTENYKSVRQLIGLLKKYKSLYLKPFSKSQGKGILCVLKSNKKFLVIDERKQRYYFQDYNSMGKFLNKRVIKPSIIQQAVPFETEKKLVDFRIILQRDEDKKWSYKGCVAKISQEGSVITNKQCRQQALIGKDALTTIYNLSETAADRMEEKMITLTIKAIHIYERSGMHLGDVAADIILDSNLHLWLLELQLNHRTTEVFPERYKKIMVTPFRYAKALAGFSNNAPAFTV